MHTKTDYRTLLYTVGLILMWGLSWSVIKIGLDYIHPIFFAGLRTLIGGIVLTLFALLKRDPLSFKSTWHIYIISSLFNVILFFGLQTVALQFLPSGLLAVLVYFEPILVGFLAWLWLGENISVRKVTGLVLGFLGVLAVSFNGLFGKLSALGIVLGLAAAIAWAIGTVYLKRVQNQVSQLWLVSLQFIFGGIVLTGTGALTEPVTIHWTVPFWLSLLYCCFVGVALSWVTWLALVRRGEVSRVASYTFFVPLLSVVIGTLWLHEALTAGLFVGLVLIVAGIYLVNRQVAPRRRTGNAVSV
jgi:drug/metabolite transporter (DMT)-like permease